ncbi:MULTISPECIES: adenosine kinase [Methylobacterium]|uniref:Ribokinase n=2 Tax=Pseudomonadota TaxID=1224 RepID=A0ABQ4SQQ5_9HYPH|nr:MULTISPECIES: adenosine kinase [Methylobacterium]PIU07012.1 MAG: adenosine kinase [Methylobacterium sp. CG09_land_8_20_14_0_10_71_15]PIU14316.1 MAG: adenosine kinase [Methylobacterium sp. CG08_land_8_20_14_0_20_71_15]GBU16696.1 adenosine kinase [Methylobacterium sp.]GJE05427.1 Ribokinase [Methylobacterium jeotgali]
MSAPLDLLVLGNAIVDVIARTDDAFLSAQGLAKGAMQLIDEPRAEDLFQAMGPATIVSGGSGANTAVGAALLGARTGFVGKVREDDVGGLFAHDLKATGVRFDVPPAKEGPATARCFVLVTPDGERTMNTYLGACQGLSPADVDEATTASARVVYLEGYLWDPPAAKDAFRKAVKIAHGAGNAVALTLSDAFCVGRYRDEFLALIRDGSVDILFANIGELKSLYETEDAEEAIKALRDERDARGRHLLGLVTRSEQGSIVVKGGEVRSVEASPVREVVDTTGAGDLFAAGFLAGQARGLDYVTCAKLGSLAAAEVIQHIGARPQSDLVALARERGLL